MSDLFHGVAPLSQALGFHMERHNVLASNVAHIETPGYRPHDVQRPESQDFGQLLSAQLTQTDAAHLPAGGQFGVTHGRVIQSSDLQAGLDGNYVSLDLEATKIAENRLRYEVVSSLAAAEFRHLTFVANDGR